MRTLQQPFMLIICGPTAVGKTDAALAIAQRLPCEIINIDMGQLYVPLTIGTAKPNWRAETTPHHLFDIINEPRVCTVNEYRGRALTLINEIWARGRLPILVGGSGFYIKSLFFPPTMPAITQSSDAIEAIPASELWESLHAIDPERANHIHAHDTYRIKRALAIWHETKQKPSTQKPIFEQVAPFRLICFTRDRTQLYARINERVVQMIDAGWLREAQRLCDTPWEPFLYTKKIIGYDILLHYLSSSDQDKHAFDQAVQMIQQKTRNYAKRQITFWRMLERELKQAITMYEKSGTMASVVQEINVTNTNLDSYVEQLYQDLLPLFE